MSKPSFFTLDNGLRVVLVPCEAESVAFGVFVASGSRHESAKTAGISHFIEHMLFKGTPTRRPIDITRAIEGRGGNFNAYTSEECTCYYSHLPHEYLTEAIDIILDMYQNATIPDEEFHREKQVVLEEIKMYSDEPDAVAMENLQRSLFMRNRLGAPIAGSPESLGPMTPEDLRKYMASHYTPQSTLAVVAGRFDADMAKREISSRLGKAFSSRRGCVRSAKVDFSDSVRASVVASKDVQQTQLAIGYRTFGVSDPRRYAASLMDAVLGRGMSSRLFQEVREKRGLSYDISSRLQFFSDAGMFTITAGVDGAKADLALKTIDRELEKIRTKKISRAELERTKEFVLGNFRLGHERVISKMFHYGSSMLAFGRIFTIDEQVGAIKAVTPEDVLGVAAEILDPANRSVSRVVPSAFCPT